MYHYIYVNPDNDDLKELRYNAWIYSSLLQRQEFPAETEYGKRQKEKDLNELAKMKSIISNLNSFKYLSPKQQQSLLNSESGKLFIQLMMQYLFQLTPPPPAMSHTLRTIDRRWRHCGEGEIGRKWLRM